MGYTLPVWFGPLPAELAGRSFSGWDDPALLDLLEPRGGVLRESSSRNWSHLQALDELAGEDLRGHVAFVHREVAVVPVSGLAAALVVICDRMQARFPEAARQARASRVVEVTSDGGPLWEVDFCSFVLTLAECVRECQAEGSELLWIAAQP